MAKIKVGDKWQTYVLCIGDTWMTMNMDLFGRPCVAGLYQKNSHAHIEIWTFFRKDTGDVRMCATIAACGVCFIGGKTYPTSLPGGVEL